MTQPGAVPSIHYSGPQAKEQVALVVKKIRYVLGWIAANPELIIDGRHHAALVQALEELEPRLAPGEDDKEHWEKGGVGAIKDPDLSAVGLNGAQLALKLGVFNQHFERFLDLIALQGSKDHELQVREMNAFLRKVLPWWRRPRAVAAAADKTLDVGKTILDSVGLVIPAPFKQAFEAMGEILEMVRHAIRAMLHRK